MTYGTKKTIAGMLAGIVFGGAYVLYAIGKHAREGSADLSSWAQTMLVFIGIGIGATIVIQILLHIGMAVGIAAKNRDKQDVSVEKIMAADTREDERDKWIDLKALRINGVFMGVGGLAMLITLAMGHSVFLGMHLLFGFCWLASFVEGIAKIYMYERGI